MKKSTPKLQKNMLTMAGKRSKVVGEKITVFKDIMINLIIMKIRRIRSGQRTFYGSMKDSKRNLMKVFVKQFLRLLFMFQRS
jgi:hypothetical protein